MGSGYSTNREDYEQYKSSLNDGRLGALAKSPGVVVMLEKSRSISAPSAHDKTVTFKNRLSDMKEEKDPSEQQQNNQRGLF